MIYIYIYNVIACDTFHILQCIQLAPQVRAQRVHIAFGVIHTCVYVCVCMCICVYVYIYIYTHIHTYIYIYRERERDDSY